MKSWLLILGAAITVLNHASHAAAERKVVCYYGSWSVYRPGDGNFRIDFIDPNLCTHIIYTFVGIGLQGDIRILDNWNEIERGGFLHFNDLRKRNPSLKTLVAIGGWNEGSSTFSSVVNDASRRAAFVNNIVKFVGEYGFDGFDLDWEYPAQRGGAATDKAVFSLLIKELRQKFDKHGYLLSAAVAATKSSASISYNIRELGKYLDFINVMTYDLHGPWDPVTGHNAPLYAGSNDDGLTVDAAIQYWIKEGAPSEKVILGIGTYGRSFTLSSSVNDCIIGAPATGAGHAGPYTREGGNLGYNEICENQSKYTVRWDEQQKVPFACFRDQWVGYDDIKSVTYKAEYAVKHGLGGVMIWSLETEDFLGKCNGYKYPLLTAINRVLFGGVTAPQKPSTSQPQSTTAATTTALPPANPTERPAASTSAPSDPSQLCTREGFIRDPYDLRVFYQCLKASGKLVAHRLECPKGLIFDTSLNVCNWIDAVAN
ncbi:Acidic mammalian chitinase [Cryptotermes secundus]|uniref:Acidic mammalian chitinase n=2 Tax=Cryptotermes secundus TaxID=105785 RepID=A0A2J7PSQ3_9NEOP|nr:chitinase-3-like protein 1 isoform X2 [Cryptotermes secundus]PNF19362.1 Acidic mammalian chitinase [Cryptotermes secundus]PNF19364.1 Acidic mammalian chitinase [Cryptotermes secundus]